MAWYDEAFFYHIYPLGLCGAPRTNSFGGEEHRLRDLWRWVDHLQALGVTALYIGPLFESGSHGYDTANYRRLDRRLGSNEDLKAFVRYCHDSGIRVVLDAVFNHTSNEHEWFKAALADKNSPYRDWYIIREGKRDKEVVHKVVAGDNLFRISMKYKCSINEIKKWNNMAEDHVIHVGDEIKIYLE